MTQQARAAIDADRGPSSALLGATHAGDRAVHGVQVVLGSPACRTAFGRAHTHLMGAVVRWRIIVVRSDRLQHPNRSAGTTRRVLVLARPPRRGGTELVTLAVPR